MCLSLKVQNKRSWLWQSGLLILLAVPLGCATKQGFYHRVVRGETVPKISRAYQISPATLAHANNMRAISSLREGQYLLIPSGGKRQSEIPAEFRDGSLDAKLNHRFSWPLADARYHKIDVSYGPHNKKRHSGVDLLASPGTSVVAAADGKIVYAGDKVPGFGNTIIVRHSQEFFSIYSFLKTIAVQPEQSVKQGDTLGTVGTPNEPHFDQNVAMLHFEIRDGTIPMDPEDALPRKTFLTKLFK